MAINYASLAGRTTGTIGNIIFWVDHTINKCRLKPDKVKNPRTEAQQKNRSNISYLLEIYRTLKPILYLSLNNRQENRKPYHEFLSKNLNNSMKNGIFFPINLVLSGSMCDIDIFEFTLYPGQNKNLKLTWLNSSDETKLNSDLLCLVVYNSDSKAFQYFLNIASRIDSQAEINIIPGPIYSKNYIYCFFVRSDFSDSGKIALLEQFN